MLRSQHTGASTQAVVEKAKGTAEVLVSVTVMPRLKEGVQWAGMDWAAGALCTEKEEACRCRWRTLCTEQGGSTAGTFTGAQPRSPWGWNQAQSGSSTEVSKVGKAWTMAWL